jgi:hypothetical protein
MEERKLRIVKLTPIALASCDRCKLTFHSYQHVEDAAEREMKVLFEVHDCELVTLVRTLIGQPNAFFHGTDAQAKVVISTCCLCGHKLASSDIEVLRIAERAHACVQLQPK